MIGQSPASLRNEFRERFFLSARIEDNPTSGARNMLRLSQTWTQSVADNFSTVTGK